MLAKIHRLRREESVNWPTTACDIHNQVNLQSDTIPFEKVYTVQVSHARQDCTCLIKNTVKTIYYLNFKYMKFGIFLYSLVTTLHPCTYLYLFLLYSIYSIPVHIIHFIFQCIFLFFVYVYLHMCIFYSHRIVYCLCIVVVSENWKLVTLKLIPCMCKHTWQYCSFWLLTTDLFLWLQSWIFSSNYSCVTWSFRNHSNMICRSNEQRLNEMNKGD